MLKIRLSNALYEDGMNALEGKADCIIPNNCDIDQTLDHLKDVDAEKLFTKRRDF